MLLLILSQLLSFTASQSNQKWEVTGTSRYPEKIFAGLIMEGLCNDGRNFFVNTKDKIYSITSNFDEVLFGNTDAIPHDLRSQYGFNHLGDCQFNEGLLYFPVEEPSYNNPSIFVYNISDNSIDFLKHELQPNQAHMPWIALNTENNILYSSEYNSVNKLFKYSIDLQYLGEIEIKMELNEVQGGAFYEGLLYLGVNSGNTVYAVNVTSGEVNIAVQQTTPDSKEEYEFEGLTFLDLTVNSMGLMHNNGNHMHPAVVTHCDLQKKQK